jgi:hypothetical protein
MTDVLPGAMGGLDDAFGLLRDRVPSLFVGLNVAQYRAIKVAYTPDKKTGLLPSFTVVSFANGCGKTHLCVLDMIGWTCGSSFFNKEAFPAEAISVWDSDHVSRMRDKGTLSLRLCCMADDMKAGGSLYVIVKELFPWAVVSAPDATKTFREIVVRNPNNEQVVNTIAVKTFDQDPLKHSGSTCQKIFINEPMPIAFLGETIGRIRSKGDSPDGSITMYATLLDQANWVQDLEDDPNLRVSNCRGHIFENCIGEQVTDEMAYEVERTIGTKLEKLAGEGYKTNGVLKRAQIDSMVSLWQRVCPHQLEARKSGAPLGGTGRIYVTYKTEVHRLPAEYFGRVPEKYPVIQIVDPHSAKPDFSAWAVITPQDRLHVIAEWPTVNEFGFYDELSERRLTIEQTCETWRKIESDMGITFNVTERLGDPNKFKSPDPNRMHHTLANDYQMHGFQFNINVNDDLEFGHAKVMEYLHYDQAVFTVNPSDPMAVPRLTISERCENIHRSMGRYAMRAPKSGDFSVTSRVNQRYKDPCDVIRYLVVWHAMNRFADISQSDGNSSDYAKIRAGRVPKRFRNDYSFTGGFKNQGFNPKGRKVWQT